MGTPDNELRPGEYWVTQIDPDTGRITNTIEQNWLLAPFYGLWELVSGPMTDADKTFVVVLLVLIAYGAS